MVIDENGEKRLVESEERIQSSALMDTVKDFPTDLIKGFTVEVNLRYNKLFEDMFSASEILYGCLIDYGLRDGEIFDRSLLFRRLKRSLNQGIPFPICLKGRCPHLFPYKYLA